MQKIKLYLLPNDKLVLSTDYPLSDEESFNWRVVLQKWNEDKNAFLHVTGYGLEIVDMRSPKNSVKRYLVFAHGVHDPLGGWEDLIGMADTEEEAISIADNRPEYDYVYRIVDTQDLSNHILSSKDKLDNLLGGES